MWPLATKCTEKNVVHRYHYSVLNMTSQRRFSSSHAVVDHAEAYVDEMDGRHGHQLSLAYNEGVGKDRESKAYPLVEEDDWLNLDEYDSEEEEDVELVEGSNLEEREKAELEMIKNNEVILEDIEGEDDLPSPPTIKRYRKDGFPRRKPSELASLRAGAPGGGSFAVVRLAGIQHKVTIDDLIICNKLKPVSKWAVGKTLTLTNEEVLLMGSPERTLVGMPYVIGGEVDVMVEEITMDKKIIIFKKRKRKNSQRKNGFRREVTFLRVLDVRMPIAEQDIEAEKRVAV